ncbi:MAG: DegT/DnrJ/EryC1/StrS aminotransferase [Dehalococcoidia bacterium]|nr:DegT/DnrJ/EryC1/StrS aminotransferase [Dehalococcoidia bacterium]
MNYTRAKLAIEGGEPVRSTYLPYGMHWVDEEDIQAVVDVLRTGWLTTGPKVAEFEEAFAEQVGARYAVALSSGTAGLHAAVYALGVGPGDEVITTPYTFAASANCVLFQGGTAVFADVDEDTFNISPRAIEERITSRTKAIIPVHFAGHPCDMDEIVAIARRHGLTIIEDACHALGAEYKGVSIGGIGDMSVFSLHPVKHITAGEGGVVTTNNPHLAERLRSFRNHSMSTDARERMEAGAWYYEVTDLGYNYRLTDLQCALALSQLKKLEHFVELRNDIAAQYTQALSLLPEVIPPGVRPDVRHAWHIYVVRLDSSRLEADREAIFAALRAENIGVNVHYIPVHLHPYYRERFGYKRGDYPVAEAAYDSAITLPLFPKMTHQDVRDVLSAVEKVVERYRKTEG